MLEEYKNQEKELKSEISSLMEKWRNAGDATSGDLMNIISGKKSKLEEIQGLIAEELVKKNKTSKKPNQYVVVIFVITNYIDNIKKHVPEDIFSKIPPERNPNGKFEDWIPYYDERNKTIEELLKEFKDMTGYNFITHYSNGQNNKKELSNLINDKSNDAAKIGIIDLLSINKKNEYVATRFDNPRERKSTVLPICLNLNKDLQNYMLKRKSDLFSVLDAEDIDSCMFSEIMMGNQFLRSLKTIFRTMVEIENKILGIEDKNKDIRNINFGLL